MEHAIRSIISTIFIMQSCCFESPWNVFREDYRPYPLYAEAIPKNRDQVEIRDINEQYLFEFLDALQSSINQMSMDGVRIS